MGKNTNGKRKNYTNQKGKAKEVKKGNPRDERDCGSNSERSLRSTHNSPQWYNNNPTMIKAAGNFSFLASQGSPYSIGNTDVVGHNPLQSRAWTQTNPGIMAIDFVPTFGASGQKYDALNAAAQSVFTYIRNTNSGAKNYDAPDLMMMLLSLDNLYMAWNYAKLAYGSAMQFSAVNKYMAENTIKAMGFNYPDVINNLADHRLRLNAIAAKISTICAPAKFELFLRHSFLTSNIFADEPNGKAGFYIFRPAGFYIFSETASEQGSSLVWTDRPSSLTNWLDYIEIGLNRLLYSYDVGIMSGDVLKAYGEGGVYKLSPVTEDYRVLPTFDAQILSQIENMYTYPVDLSDLEITQDMATLTIDNPIAANPEIVDDYPPLNLARRIVNVHTLDPDPLEVAYATRLTTAPGENHLFLKVYGTEVPVSMQVYYITEQEGLFELYQTSVLQSCIYSTGFTGLIAHIWSKFNYAPRVDIITLDGTTYYYEGCLGDLDVFTVINDKQLDNLHSVCLYSLWGVPAIGSF